MAAETATERDFRRRRIFRLGLSRACHRLCGSYWLINIPALLRRCCC
jgi:hypothetical protein